MKKFKISTLILLTGLLSLNINLFAQPIEYFDDYYGNFATGNSRVVTTIKEFENSNEVHLEVILIGKLNVGAFQINLHYDPAVVVPIMGPGGKEITSKLNGSGDRLGKYLTLNPDLPNEHIWRSMASGQINPHKKMPWIYVLAGGNEGMNTHISLEAGEILPVYKIYFKKLPGKTLTNQTFTYFEKLNQPVVRNMFSRGSAFICMSGNVNNTNTFLDTYIFSRRIPSTIKTEEAEVI
jgi:hypothetical protein